MTSWLTALRIARREARRAKGRSALVVAMIALPVLALSYAAVSYDMFTLTPAEEITRDLGAADARLQWLYDGPVQQDAELGSTSASPPRTRAVTPAEVLAALPAGSRVIPEDNTIVALRTAAGVGRLTARGLDGGGPQTRGLVEILDGRAPADDREVALTRAAAERLGVGLGGTVHAGDGARTWTAVGIVEFPNDLADVVVFRPTALPGAAGLHSDGRGWLVDTPGPVAWPQVEQLNTLGIIVTSRTVMLDPPSPEQTAYDGDGDSAGGVDGETLGLTVLAAGLGLLEVVLLAGPAFAVGARRRQRDLALVAANGGTPAHLRRIVLADGVVLGVVGAVTGLALGIAAAFAGRPLMEQYVTHSRAGGYRGLPLALLAIAGLAVVTGVLAALVPACTAARQDVVAGLTGRRGIVRSRKRWLVVGLTMTGAGVAVTASGAARAEDTLILAGVVLTELGLVLCTPALVGLLARLGRGLPLTPRIALRDTARNRAAAAPAISAVMAAVAGSVAIGMFLASDQTQRERSYQPSLPYGHVTIGAWSVPDLLSRVPVDRVDAAARALLPVDRVAEVREVQCPSPAPAQAPQPGISCSMYPVLPKERECPFWEVQGELSAEQKRAARRDERCTGQINSWSSGLLGAQIVGDGAAVAVISGASAADVAEASRVLAAGGAVTSDARYVVDGRIILEIFDGIQGQASEPRRITVPAHVLTSGIRIPSTIISPGAAAAAKLPARPAGVVVATTAMPSQAEEDRLRAALQAIDRNVEVSVERGAPPDDNAAALILGIAAGVITLGAAAIATGLAAADGRADLSTLAAVGASPRVRRLLSLSQSGVIAGLGSLLGVVAGLGAAFAVLYALNRSIVDRWPSEQPYPLAIPWESLLVVLVVPVVAMLGAGLLTRSRLPIERRVG